MRRNGKKKRKNEESGAELESVGTTGLGCRDAQPQRAAPLRPLPNGTGAVKGPRVVAATRRHVVENND